ncbi:iron ABC transporter substrate-binding protein [Corynebacterium atypicum]|uniref:Iron ABC transporter substrate-binding protein n=1 Tax=Corynebacterium atypicum TaxID=191610 RepID=A0ABM5QLZ3_9CORY|nr:ABC transporter substrate-binding protein [Corynebacterium atypicum]AIG63828.1 iron ABC transporter substrate-binding protein [Corynebacterium atypicum]
MAKFRHALVAVTAATALVLTGCSNAENGTSANSSANNTASSSEAVTATSVTVEDNYSEKTIELPIERVVSLDNRTFEVLDEWGVKLEAAPRKLVPHSIPGIKDDDSIVDIGNHREPNLEAIVAADPQVIVSGQCFTKYDDQIEEMNPQATLVEFEPRDGEPLDQELKRQVTALGKIFDKEDEAKKIVEDFDAALKRAKEAYDGQSTVMAVNVSGGEIGYIAPSIGRTYGPLFDLLNLKPALEVEGASSDHKGDDISVEAIADSNPDFLMVLDRDAGTSAGDAPDFKPAESVIKESALLQNVKAVKDGKVYIAPADTYTNESILTYTEILNDLADQFEAAK